MYSEANFTFDLNARIFHVVPKSYNSLGLNKTKMEIEEVLNNQVDPYLTQRYGKPRNCGGPGWTEVVDLDMSNDSMECPTGFTLFSFPVRSCGRPGSENNVTAYFTVKHSYTNICGTIVGIQKGSTDGFGPTFYDSRPMHYVDGIIIWHGSSYSQGHIWTCAAAPRQLATNVRLGCPCSYEQWNFNIPTFVGSNYFCDSGISGAFSRSTIFLDNPLWDGKGCIVPCALNSWCLCGHPLQCPSTSSFPCCCCPAVATDSDCHPQNTHIHTPPITHVYAHKHTKLPLT